MVLNMNEGGSERVLGQVPDVRAMELGSQILALHYLSACRKA